MGVQLPFMGYINPFVTTTATKQVEQQRVEISGIAKAVQLALDEHFEAQILVETDDWGRPILWKLLDERGGRGSLVIPDFRHLKHHEATKPVIEALQYIRENDVPVVVLHLGGEDNRLFQKAGGDALLDAIIRRTLRTRDEIGNVVHGLLTGRKAEL